MEKRILVHALALKLKDVVFDVENEADEAGRVPRFMLDRVRDILDEIEKNQ